MTQQQQQQADSMATAEALAYARRAAAQAIAVRGADVADVAAEALARLLERGTVTAEAEALRCETGGTVRAAIAAAVRYVARETTLGRTGAERAQRERYGRTLSADRANGAHTDAQADSAGASLAETFAAPVADDTCEPWQAEAQQADGSVLRIVSAYGLPCEADWQTGSVSVWHMAADGYTVLQHATGSQALAMLRKARGLAEALATGAGTVARASQSVTQSAQRADADRDSAVLSVAGLPWQQALERLADMGHVMSRATLRKAQSRAQRRAAGEASASR
jgi:hypothetical protein